VCEHKRLHLQCARSRPWLKLHTAILEFWTGISNRKQRIMWNHVEEHCKAFEQRRFALIGAPSHASPFVPCPRLHVSATQLSRRQCTWHANPQVCPTCVHPPIYTYIAQLIIFFVIIFIMRIVVIFWPELGQYTLHISNDFPIIQIDSIEMCLNACCVCILLPFISMLTPSTTTAQGSFVMTVAPRPVCPRVVGPMLITLRASAAKD
jgi:hypothetical protein